MSAGITRVHGAVAAPSQRPSTLSFFTIEFPASVVGQVGVVNGAVDKTINACSLFATVAMIGTVGNHGSGTGRNLRIALEDTGVDSLSPSGLGMGLPDEESDTAAALQTAIQALGTVNGIALGSATVSTFTL